MCPPPRRGSISMRFRTFGLARAFDDCATDMPSMFHLTNSGGVLVIAKGCKGCPNVETHKYTFPDRRTRRRPYHERRQRETILFCPLPLSTGRTGKGKYCGWSLA